MDNDELLILQVQSFPALYDKKDQRFKNKLAKENAWKTIAAILETDPATCEQRWTTLRAKYTNIKKKIRDLPSGSGAPSQTTWPYFDIMQFLDPYLATRRRPYNLLSDYARRRRRVKWLDTHIWHAKRFHMIEKWGYKLPQRPCDKSFKACYRATTKHCLVQDNSYNQCIEITGYYDHIVENLSKITDSNVGLTFGAACYAEGKIFGEVTVFDPFNNENEFRRAIGQVEFLWNTKNNTENRIIWIFIHPAFYKQLLELLLCLFNLNLVNMEIKEELDGSVRIYEGPRGIILKELQYELNKFRLTGPLSTAVLKNALKPVNFEEKSSKLPSWYNTVDLEKLNEQNAIFNDISDLSFIPPNMVLSLTVHDPRFNFPKKRSKAFLTTVSGDNDNFDALRRNISFSPLWNEDVRKYVKNNKIPNVKICEMRSQLLVPGTDLEEKGESVPVILLWRTGNKGMQNNGYSSGWDIIVPSSWSQSFFMSFIMWGARAGGLRETNLVAYEKSQCDILYPDTVAGEDEEKFVSEELRARFFRLPPNKRTNFSKFGIVSPLCFHWKLLLKNWSENNLDCSNFFVLRNRATLKSIQEFLTSKSGSTAIPLLSEMCLIPVKITPLKTGLCSKFSTICVPQEEDFKNEPVEPLYKDLLAKTRNKLRKDHKILRKTLRKRRKRAKTAGRPIIRPDANLLESYKVQMRKLWLPEPKTIKHSCIRNIMGFVKHGDFSFTSGQSKGLGYIVARSLQGLSSLPSRNRVLIRNTNSRQYRLASLEIVFE